MIVSALTSFCKFSLIYPDPVRFNSSYQVTALQMPAGRVNSFLYIFFSILIYLYKNTFKNSTPDLYTFTSLVFI